MEQPPPINRSASANARIVQLEGLFKESSASSGTSNCSGAPSSVASAKSNNRCPSARRGRHCRAHHQLAARVKAQAARARDRRLANHAASCRRLRRRRVGVTPRGQIIQTLEGRNFAGIEPGNALDRVDRFRSAERDPVADAVGRTPARAGNWSNQYRRQIDRSFPSSPQRSSHSSSRRI